VSLLSTSIPERLVAAAERAGLRGAGFLVAVSGGLDSVCLLHLLTGLVPGVAKRVEAAHLDHGLRPDSAADADFCRDLAADLGVPFHLRRLRAGELRRGLGLQAAARNLRRTFLQEVRAARGLEAIVLGHHADDQVETVLFRLLRGAGPRGLAGMAEWSPPFFRPLLGVHRRELQELASRQGWLHREDPSNRSPRYARNRLRHEALPLLRQIHPGADEALLRLARLLREEDELLSGEAARAFSRLATEHPEGVRLEAGALRELAGPIRRRVYLAAWESLGLDPGALESRHLDAVDRLLEPGRAHRRAAIPGPGIAAASYEEIWFLRPGTWERRTVVLSLAAPGRRAVPELGVTVCWESEPPRACAGVPVPAAAREVGVALRTWQPGDRVPVRAGRVRKVKDLLMEARIPAWRRSRALVVQAGEGLAGVLAGGQAWGWVEDPAGWVWVEDPSPFRGVELPGEAAEKRCCGADRCDT